jgi:hypothetical protein
VLVHALVPEYVIGRLTAVPADESRAFAGAVPEDGLVELVEDERSGHLARRFQAAGDAREPRNALDRGVLRVVRRTAAERACGEPLRVDEVLLRVVTHLASDPLLLAWRLRLVCHGAHAAVRMIAFAASLWPSDVQWIPSVKYVES